MTMRVESLPLAAAPSRLEVRIGWAISGLVALFLIGDAIAKIIASESTRDATREIGYPTDQLVILGIVLLAVTALYVLPRTAVIGVILLTGYLGGAVAINARLESGWFLFPLAMGVLAWVGLSLRDGRVQRLLRSMIDA